MEGIIETISAFANIILVEVDKKKVCGVAGKGTIERIAEPKFGISGTSIFVRIGKNILAEDYLKIGFK